MGQGGSSDVQLQVDTGYWEDRFQNISENREYDHSAHIFKGKGCLEDEKLPEAKF